SPPDSSRRDVGNGLLVGALVADIVGFVLAVNAPPHVYDAINIYNDGVSAESERWAEPNRRLPLLPPGAPNSAPPLLPPPPLPPPPPPLPPPPAPAPAPAPAPGQSPPDTAPSVPAPPTSGP